MACGGRTYATRRPSPSCGRHSVPGSPTRPSSPPTTRRSTVASWTPAAPGTGCVRRQRGLPAPCSSPVRSGGSVRRHCPMSADGSGSRYVTTMPKPTRWRARASCSRPKPMAGGLGSVEHAERTPAPSYALHGLPPGRGGRTGCTGCPSNTCCTPGGGDCGAESRHVCAGVEAAARLAASGH